MAAISRSGRTTSPALAASAKRLASTVSAPDATADKAAVKCGVEPDKEGDVNEVSVARIEGRVSIEDRGSPSTWVRMVISSRFPPEGSCDCHVHVIGPRARFPLAQDRSYTPPDAPADGLRRMLDDLGLSRVVIVQPSVYGTDNSCLLAALDELGPRARGVAVLAPDTPPPLLDALHRQGVRGVRVNVASVRDVTPHEVEQRFREAARLCERNGWHVQTFLPAARLAEFPDLSGLPVPLVLDHFGLVSPERPGGPDLGALLSRLESGRVWVKLSAPYRITERTADPGVAALARLLAHNPERILWGSDWPHTPPHTGSGMATEEETPYRTLSTLDLLKEVVTWFPEPAIQKRLLVDNPAQLYGWACSADTDAVSASHAGS